MIFNYLKKIIPHTFLVFINYNNLAMLCPNVLIQLYRQLHADRMKASKYKKSIARLMYHRFNWGGGNEMVLENWNIYLHQLVAETYQYHKKIRFKVKGVCKTKVQFSVKV